MIKAIFFDLDGTLLDSGKKIPPSSAAALKKCREKSIKLFVATARPPLLKKMLGLTDAELALFDGGVYYNGGCEKVDGKTEYKYIPSQVVNTCLGELGRRDGLSIALQLKDELHAFSHPLNKEFYGAWGLDERKIVPVGDARLNNVVKLLVYCDSLVDSDTTIPADLVAALRCHCGTGAKLYLTDSGRVVQIISADTDKYKSIERIRLSLGLETSEISVFGDDVNDIEMLQGYMYSVAMGNAPDEVKASALMVTGSNDDGGIAYALRKFRLI